MSVPRVALVRQALHEVGSRQLVACPVLAKIEIEADLTECLQVLASIQSGRATSGEGRGGIRNQGAESIPEFIDAFVCSSERREHDNSRACLGSNGFDTGRMSDPALVGN